jgi:hypothetical protein
VESGAQCQTNFSLQDEEGGRYCSVVCTQATDCPSAAPRCISVTLPRPDNATTQVTNACARDPI